MRIRLAHTTLRLPPSSPSSVSEACGPMSTRVALRRHSSALNSSYSRFSVHEHTSVACPPTLWFRCLHALFLLVSSTRWRTASPLGRSHHDELAPPGGLKYHYSRISPADTRLKPENAASASLSATTWAIQIRFANQRFVLGMRIRIRVRESKLPYLGQVTSPMANTLLAVEIAYSRR